jgi:plasmid stabilization system protein ParE
VKRRILRAARVELSAAATWYNQQAPGLGADLLKEMDRAIERIAETPKVWPFWPKTPGDLEIRRFLVPRFRYSIAYMIENNELIIIAFAHQHRRPLYWISRLQNLI